ncbi:MAG: ABC transporter substrate-binding protein, partial [Candidatus Thorarchaeota archaeon]
MQLKRYRKFLAFCFLITTITFIHLPVNFVSGVSSNSKFSKAGPYIDSIRCIPLWGDEAINALQEGDVDVIFEMIDPVFLDALNDTQYIEIVTSLRNGFGYFSINTGKYPFNITELRRAMAFAFDKNRVADEVLDGLGVPQDCIIPQQNPFSLENLRDYNYYDSDVETANQLLDRSGFIDTNGDSYREAPNGLAFHINIEVAQSSAWAREIGDILEENLISVGLNATCSYVDFYEYLNRLYFHGDFDIGFLGSSFSNFNVDWLANVYWSEYADEPYCNYPSWRNSTFDSWRDQLLHGCSFQEVYDAAIEMQKICTYACPEIIIYPNLYPSVYRSDKFTNFAVDCTEGIGNWWTLYNVKPLHASFGGTLNIAAGLGIDYFSPICSCGDYHANMQRYYYDSLVREDPNGNLIPWLAKSYFIENHEDNPSIPEGRTRFYFEMLDNATWTDGEKVTAFDAAFTLNYYRDVRYHPFKADMLQMTSAYSIDNKTLVVEFNGESYWHLYDFGSKPILPAHFF